MLYPKKCINKKENKFLERLEYIKENVIMLLNSCKSYNSFILFLKKKIYV